MKDILIQKHGGCVMHFVSFEDGKLTFSSRNNQITVSGYFEKVHIGCCLSELLGTCQRCVVTWYDKGPRNPQILHVYQK